MSRSGMLMKPDEIASMEAEMGPDATTATELADTGDKGVAAAKPLKDDLSDIEIVGPDDAKKADADKPATEKKADDKAKPAEAETGGFGKIQENLNKALREERDKRRQIENELRERDIRHARLEERLSLINQQIERGAQPAQAAKPGNEPPKWEEDPIAAGAYWANRVATLEQQLASGQQQSKQQLDEQTRQQQYMQQVTGAYHADAESFAETHPDFGDAYKFVLAGYEKEYGHLPQFRGNKQAVRDYLKQLEWSIVVAALNNRESPAEAIYNLATARGYKPAGQEQAQAEKAAADVAAASKAEADKVAALARAQDAAQTLSGNGGSAPGKMKLSLESIDAMSPKELETFISRLMKAGGEAEVNRMMARLEGIA